MKRSPHQREPLARHIMPELDEARLARQRAVIRDKVERGRPRRWYLLVAPAITAAVIGVVLLSRPHGTHDPSVVAGTVVEAPEREPMPVTLVDGSHVVLDPQTRLGLVSVVPKDIRLRLERGTIDLDVVHTSDRRFVVIAADYEVNVVGTKLRVDVEPGDAGTRRVEVRVTEGVVRVRRWRDGTELHVLHAGEAWSTDLTTTDLTTHDAPVEAPLVSAVVPTVSSVPSTSSTAATTPRATGPKELWTQAETARAAKRFRDEAAALDVLRTRYRSDPRAGLAAFELGRLRQDTLGDPSGAAEAFADAVVLSPNGPFREDAEARRVEALDAAGRTDACVEAKRAFLARYPGSIHRTRLESHCMGR